MSFAKRLRRGDRLVGTMLTLPAPEVAEMASKCGVDWLFLDGEHGALSMLGWQRVMQAAAGRCANLLRIPAAGEVAVKQALDIGADGIIVPMVNSAEQARDVVRWAKYPPRGGRGVGLARAQGYGLDLARYVATADAETVVVVQAEHVRAVEAIDEIAAVEGIDAVFVGPYDLSASMGRTGEVGHPEVVAAIETVSEACRRAGVARGIFGMNSADVRPYAEAGFSLLCAGVDAAFVTRGVRDVVTGLGPAEA